MRQNAGRWVRTCMAATFLTLAAAGGAPAQIPDRAVNLQVLPSDLPRDSVVEIMRGFSFALGVRCQYCHVGGDGVSFEGVVFESDDDPDKLKARHMLEMVRDLNEFVLAALPERDSPAVEVSCSTCHRGRPRPVQLAQELRMALDDFGPDSAVARYERFRGDEGTVLSGVFDFGEWEVNVLAERLAGEGRPRDAIAMYELNARHYPGSISIHSSLGALFEEVGDVGAAISSWERVLELSPENARARARLDALRRR
jgi:tetratricopeptide (TPR) repeat protein